MSFDRGFPIVTSLLVPYYLSIPYLHMCCESCIHMCRLSTLLSDIRNSSFLLDYILLVLTNILHRSVQAAQACLPYVIRWVLPASIQLHSCVANCITISRDSGHKPMRILWWHCRIGWRQGDACQSDRGDGHWAQLNLACRPTPHSPWFWHDFDMIFVFIGLVLLCICLSCLVTCWMQVTGQGSDLWALRHHPGAKLRRLISFYLKFIKMRRVHVWSSEDLIKHCCSRTTEQ